MVNAQGSNSGSEPAQVMGDEMRLICPNCGAQYEVPDEVIPFEGRDVQCSNCSTTWFQKHPSQDEGLSDELDAHSVEPVTPPENRDISDAEPEQEPDTDRPGEPVPVQRGLDPEVTDVLRQEVAHERAARQAEQGAPLESQPDLGLDDSGLDEEERRAKQARDRMARLRGDSTSPETAVAAVTAAAGSRRDLLPDIEEINSTLRASGDRKRPVEATDSDLPDTTPRLINKNNRFRRGFYGVLLVAILAVCAYIYGPQISAAVPASDPYVTQYSAQVNKARSWLSNTVDHGFAWLDKMASENL